jgi:ABC-type multidrug transport system fused ATPase/permease subunit
MLGTLHKLLRLLDARQRLRWASLVPLSLLSAALEAAGAAAVLALIRLVSQPGAADSDGLLQAARKLAPDLEPDRFLAGFAVALAVFYVGKNAVRLLETWARERCTAASAEEISAGLLRAYLHAPYPFHLRRNSADLIRNTLRLADGVSRGTLHSATTLASECLVVVGVLGVVVHSMPGVALAVGTGAALAAFAILRLTQGRHTRWGELNHQLDRAMLKHLQQSLSGVKSVKVMGREERFADEFRELRHELGRLSVARGVASMAPRLVVETAFVAAIAAVVVVVGGSPGPDLLPLLGLFAYAGARLLPSLHWIVYHANVLRFSSARVDALEADWLELDAGRLEPFPEVAPPLPFEHELRVQGVSFTYENSPRPALDAVDLVVPAATSVGIVGATGSGKSTLLDVLLGLLEPQAGRILVDGTDVAEHTRAWQTQIGYVPQEVVLLDESLRRNVALGLRDDEIDDAQVRRALEMAQLRERAAALPDGLDTLLGERGTRLSGGERQRVAVARALYHDPRVLIFDEATAALDAECERALTGAIESLQRKKTVLVVAHRLATVRHCDRLVVLRNGRVVAAGPWDALAADSEDFRRLMSSL